MATKNAINSNIPIEIALGGTNTISFTHTDGLVYYDGTRLNNLATGTAGQVLTSAGAGYAPSFQTFTGGASTPIGAMQYFAVADGDAYLGSDWMACDGRVLSQTTYSTLYSRVGRITDGSWASLTTLTSGVYSVAYGGGLYVGASATAISTSTDGTTWALTATAPSNVDNLIYGDGLFMAGLDSGSIQTSTDGTTWATPVSSVLGGGLVYGLGSWVVWTGSGVLSTSTDAVTWTPMYLDTLNQISSFATNDGWIIGVGPPYQGRPMPPAFVWSRDATTWFSCSPCVGGGSGGDMDDGGHGGPAMSWDGGCFLGVGKGIGPITSTDGAAWTALTQTFPFADGVAILHEGAYYVMIGTGQSANSTDGITWNSMITGTSGVLSALLYDGGNWIYGADGGVIGSCADITMTTWTLSYLTTTGNIKGLAYNGSNLHVAIGTVADGETYCALATSTDAVTWTTRTATDMIVNMFSATYGGGKFLAGGGSGTLAYSSNGTAWTVTASPSTNNINNVGYYGGVYIYAAQQGDMGYSTDAVTWTAISGATTNFQGNGIQALAYNGSAYVCGGPGWTATSTDAVTWSFNSVVYSDRTITNAYLNAITYSSFIWVIGDNKNNVIQGAQDEGMISWTTHSIGHSWSRLGFGFGNFIGVNPSGEIGTSTNGITWATWTGTYEASEITTGTDFVVIGGNPGLYYSDAGYPYGTGSFMIPTQATPDITVESPSSFIYGLYIKAT